MNIDYNSYLMLESELFSPPWSDTLYSVEPEQQPAAWLPLCCSPVPGRSRYPEIILPTFQF